MPLGTAAWQSILPAIGLSQPGKIHTVADL